MHTSNSTLMTRTWLFAALLGAGSPAFAGLPAIQQAKIPLIFEPNRGQAPAGAEFVARGTGYFLTLDQDGSRILLRKGAKAAEVRTRLVDARPSAEMAGSSLLPGRSFYYRGKDAAKWITDLPNFAQIKVSGAYPGIDVIYYGNQNKLEYDYVVSPGADPSKIQMAVEGVSHLRITKTGDLALVTPAGEIIEQKPTAYQTLGGVRKIVQAKFHVSGRNHVSFDLGEYDRSAQLTIDPVLIYSSFLGGTDDDYGNSVAADLSGNMYMAGTTYSTQTGDADVLARKFSADGTTALYTADFGGSGDDFGNGIAIDANGYAYIGGRTNSGDFPTANAFQNQNYGANNAFVVGLDPAGKVTFSTYLGGSNDDRGYGVAVDTQGSVYLTGYTTSNDFPTNTGAFQRTRQGGTDAFVAKFGPDGTAVYSTFLGGGSDDAAYGIAVDNNGNAYVTGETFSNSFPQANAPYQHSRHGGQEGFVTELNNDGSGLIFSTFIGGAGDDVGNGIALDPSGNIYVVGTTTSDSDFSIPNRSFNTGYNGGASDIFVAKYTTSGQSLAWTTFLGSHGTDDGSAIAVDSRGNVYVAGDTDSDQYPVTRDAFQSSRGGGFDAVLSVLDTNGQNLTYSTFYGGRGDDSASSVAVDPFNQVYLTGSTASGDLFVNSGAYQNSPGGGNSDAFLAKLSVSGSEIPGTSAAPILAPQTSAAPQAVSPRVFGRNATQSQAADFAIPNSPVATRGDSVQALSRHKSSRKPSR